MRLLLQVISLLLVSITLHAAEERSSVSEWSWDDVEGVSYLSRSQTEYSPQYCRSSWAFAVTSALSSRLKIASTIGEISPVLSPQVLLNCSPGNCTSGSPLIAYEYIQKNGIPDETCQNYEGKEFTCDDVGICQDCKHGDREAGEFLPGYCFGVENYTLYGLAKYGIIKKHPSNGKKMVEEMKKEIHHHGPITCKIYPSKDFHHYKEGIVSNSMEEASSEVHYINLIGWKETKHSKLWIGENSWGMNWGYGGLFYIEMGINALGVESHCTWGKPTHHHLASSPLSNDGQRAGKKLKFEHCSCINQPEDFTPELSFSEPMKNVEIPRSYDIRNLNGVNYATIDKNQHIPQYCGSCWAFSPSSALADRFSLLYKGSSRLFDFSNQVLINCVKAHSRGCRGGWPFFVYQYILYNGIPHENCAPYRAFNETCEPVHVCKKCKIDQPCKPISQNHYLAFYITKHGQVRGEKQMKREIASGGPVVCLMAISEEFLNYTGGIINDTRLIRSVDHAVEVTGWGEENGIEYWIIRNSWGTYWGENGWARIAIGVGDFGLAYYACDWAKPKPLHDPHLLGFQSIFEESQQPQVHLET